MDKQEYYTSTYGYVTIYADVTDNTDLVVVKGGEYEDDLNVVRRDRLVKKEDSYQYKEANKRKQELEDIVKKSQDRVDAIADKVVDSALIALASRMKFNAFFSKDVNNGTASWAMSVIKELQDLVKEKAPEIVKKKEKDEFPF